MKSADMAAYMRNRHAERLAKATEYLGGNCSECGSEEELEFHHVDPETKHFTISDKLSKLSWENLLVELDKCVLLCGGCHKEVHSWAHGTLAGHRYCKCPLCRAAKRDYMREYMKSYVRPSRSKKTS